VGTVGVVGVVGVTTTPPVAPLPVLVFVLPLPLPLSLPLPLPLSPPMPQPSNAHAEADIKNMRYKWRKIMAFLSRLIYSLPMRLLYKSLFLAIVMFGLQTAHAEWKLIGNFPAGNYYIEANTLEKTGVMREFWTLLDYPSAQKSARGVMYFSTRTHMQLDCKKKSVRILQFSMHAGKMLSGDMIDQQGVMREWQSIPPDTPLVKIAQMVC
jgi:hypothetical protein